MYHGEGPGPLTQHLGGILFDLKRRQTKKKVPDQKQPLTSRTVGQIAWNGVIYGLVQMFESPQIIMYDPKTNQVSCVHNFELDKAYDWVSTLSPFEYGPELLEDGQLR